MKSRLLPALTLLLPGLCDAASTSVLNEQGYLASVRSRSDLTSAYLNPALLGDLQGNRFDASATYLYAPSPRFIGTDGSRADLLDSAILPAMHLGGRLIDDCAIAGNVLAPFGLAIEHVQREAVLKTMEIGGNAGCRFGEHFSLGAGVSGLQSDAYLKDVVPLPGGLPSGRLMLDAGKSWDIGWNVGALFKLDPFQLGVAYRAPYRIQSDTRAHWRVPDALKPLLPSGHASLGANLPASFNVGTSWAMTDVWELWFNWRRQFWSQGQHLTVDFKNNLPNSVTDYAWRDSDSYAVGVGGDWRKYSLDVALFYDQTPVPNAASRQWSIPDSNRIGFLVGAGYRVTPAVKLSANYEHIGFQDSHATTVPGRYQGLEYHLLSAKVGWEF